MNKQDRLVKLFNGEKTDRIAWSTISDHITRENLKDDLKDCSIIDFYRQIGCDIIQFGNHGLNEAEQVAYPFTYLFDGVESKNESLPDGTVRESIKTKKGELVKILKHGHPLKYPVETIEDLSILIEIWSNADVRENKATAKDNNRIAEMIGDDGIFVPTLQPSPVQQLLEYEMGMENFYCLYADYPAEMDLLIRQMHRCKLLEYEYVARNMPFEMIIPIENTSTAMISPEIYRKYSMQHMRDFSDIVHRYGKKSVIHMCGHIGHLLDEIKETNLDGIHALTEAPVGDCPFDKALDVLGEDLIIIGTLNSTIFQSRTASAEDIKLELSRLFTPRIRNSRFVIWPVSDGLPTDLWRFQAVNEWIEEKGLL